MLHKLWGDTSFHRLLLKIDEDVAQGVRSKGWSALRGRTALGAL